MTANSDSILRGCANWPTEVLMRKLHEQFDAVLAKAVLRKHRVVRSRYHREFFCGLWHTSARLIDDATKLALRVSYWEQRAAQTGDYSTAQQFLTGHVRAHLWLQTQHELPIYIEPYDFAITPFINSTYLHHFVQVSFFDFVNADTKSNDDVVCYYSKALPKRCQIRELQNYVRKKLGSTKIRPLLLTNICCLCCGLFANSKQYAVPFDTIVYVIGNLCLRTEWPSHAKLLKVIVAITGNSNADTSALVLLHSIRQAFVYMLEQLPCVASMLYTNPKYVEYLTLVKQHQLQIHVSSAKSFWANCACQNKSVYHEFYSDTVLYTLKARLQKLYHVDPLPYKQLSDAAIAIDANPDKEYPQLLQTLENYGCGEASMLLMQQAIVSCRDGTDEQSSIAQLAQLLHHSAADFALFVQHVYIYYDALSTRIYPLTTKYRTRQIDGVLKNWGNTAHFHEAFVFLCTGCGEIKTSVIDPNAPCKLQKHRPPAPSCKVSVLVELDSIKLYCNKCNSGDTVKNYKNLNLDIVIRDTWCQHMQLKQIPMLGQLLLHNKHMHALCPACATVMQFDPPLPNMCTWCTIEQSSRQQKKQKCAVCMNKTITCTVPVFAVTAASGFLRKLFCCNSCYHNCVVPEKTPIVQLSKLRTKQRKMQQQKDSHIANSGQRSTHK